ncbi:MAG TPA: amino acid permease [Ignavibacteriaceae bacterium]|nr:amino acid permease [Ignavibacteriaceae bacterium]
MFVKTKKRKLNKELKLLEVYAVATGTTLATGFFILPGLAAAIAGPAIVLSYLLAIILLIPAMFSMVELATAMPKAGGIYYFIDRTLGPLFGTIGGIGTWLALILKVGFALIGMGAYIALFIPGLSIVPVAIVIAVLIGILNLLSLKGSVRLQVLLAFIILCFLLFFVGGGTPQINLSYFRGFFNSGFDSVFSAAGLVYISYIGITKVISLSEEVKNPERNLPLGIFLSLGTSFLLYGFGTAVIVGLVPMNELSGILTPAASAALRFAGKTGLVLISIAAVISFISVANAGILSASRFPFAMSRDHLMPHIFQKLTQKGIPYLSILLTTGGIILLIIVFDPTKIAKLASAFQLLMFALVCVGVIVMRESRIESYDPGYKSPFYPWMQIIGIVAPFFLIFKMGLVAISFSAGLILIAVIWYRAFAYGKVNRQGALFHIFERLGRSRYTGLDSELRGILKEKGLRETDPFDEIVTRSFVIDLKEKIDFEEVSRHAGKMLEQAILVDAETIHNKFYEGTRIGMTPVTHGIALPHFRLEDLSRAEMVLVRAVSGVHIKFNNPVTGKEDDEALVKAIFFLVSPEKNPAQHLRILAQIAERVEDANFREEWESARNDQELKEALLHDERLFLVRIDKHTSTSFFINRTLKELEIPKGCLIAFIRRGGDTIVPDGNTKFYHRDRLTIIGDPKSLAEMKIFIRDSEKNKSLSF